MAALPPKPIEVNLSKKTHKLCIPYKIHYNQQVLLIYNPMSGKKTDIKDKLTKTLFSHAILSEMYETQEYLDAFKKCRDFNIDKYSAIFIAGGDKTIHECINGMLMRPDGKQLPIGIIPNGNSNDTCKNLEINTFDQAIDTLVNSCDIIKADVCLNRLDHSTEQELNQKCKDEPDLYLKHKRYSIAKTGLAYAGNTSANIGPMMKKVLGSSAYSF